MARAVLRSQQFQAAADHRTRDAHKLLAAQRWTGAIYLAGYGVECLQKAELAQELRRIGGWQANQGSPLYAALWTHDLNLMAEVLAFPASLAGDVRRFSQSWAVDLRYRVIPHDQQAATGLIDLADAIGRQIRMRIAA